MQNNGSPLLTIKNLIATTNARFTPTDRRIAEAVISDPTLLTFGTVSRLAEKVRDESTFNSQVCNQIRF